MELEISIKKGLVKMLDDLTKYLAHSLDFLCVIGKALCKRSYYCPEFADGETNSNTVHQRE